MTEMQPLLKTGGSIFSHDDHNFKKNSLYTELLDWWRSLFLKKHHDGYEETNNMNNTGIKRPSVGFFQFFRFANRIDWLMSCIAVFAAVSYGLCVTGQLIVSGKLMGTFALQSFSDFGDHQAQCNLPNTTSTNKSCPLGISFNLLNDTKLKTNIEKFITGIGGDLGIVIAILVFSISCAVASVIIYWQLALILMCIVPLLIVFSYAFMTLTGKEATVELNAYAKAGEIAQEVFSSLRTVLSLNGAHFEQNR
ncbi:unnamed protein product [Rotaria socialis]|uniref:ABC transmembrane type-1 domain-containing protein n=1 Tax=Rotaria socialis TaxID=392032 RepID=A0A817XDW9_9BILA|nr:unnamed protein product [Rotaria socialis]